MKILHTCVIIHNILVCLLQHGELSDEVDAHDIAMSVQEVLKEFYYSERAQNLNLGDHGVFDMAENESVGISDLLAEENIAQDRNRHHELRMEKANHLWIIHVNDV